MQGRITFDKFIRDWRSLRLVALGVAGVSDDERKRAADSAAKELSELTVRYGYEAELAKAVRPYRSVTEYVKALYDSAEHESK